MITFQNKLEYLKLISQIKIKKPYFIWTFFQSILIIVINSKYFQFQIELFNVLNSNIFNKINS